MGSGLSKAESHKLRGDMNRVCESHRAPTDKYISSHLSVAPEVKDLNDQHFLFPMKDLILTKHLCSVSAQLSP